MPLLTKFENTASVFIQSVWQLRLMRKPIVLCPSCGQIGDVVDSTATATTTTTILKFGVVVPRLPHRRLAAALLQLAAPAVPGGRHAARPLQAPLLRHRGAGRDDFRRTSRDRSNSSEESAPV